MEDDEDLELMRLATKGDLHAQERFLLRHRPLLLRYLKRRIPDDLRPHIEPEDVFQDVCFDVFRRMDTFSASDPKMAVRWLLRIAHNRVVDLVRMYLTSKRGGNRLTHLHAGDSGGDDSVVKMLQELAVHQQTPSRSAVAHELLAALERGLARLPEDYQAIVRYRYIDRISFKEAGEKMNRSEKAVQKLCRRGLDALKVELRSFSRYI